MVGNLHILNERERHLNFQTEERWLSIHSDKHMKGETNMTKPRELSSLSPARTP